MITDTQATKAPVRGLETGFFGRLAEKLSRYGAYRRCVAELSALSDRELGDLGLHRSMIRSLAHEEAYRNM
ncbi:DUF1127 domain-containing protein [Pseudooceanicola pacificus]|nr:DUF1127 domain-containing protein [Pseudooceanicola pacificus]